MKLPRLRSLAVSVALFYGAASLAAYGDDGLRLVPQALLSLANSWSQTQTYNATVALQTANNTVAAFAPGNFGGIGTVAGEKISLFGTSQNSSDYSLGIAASELWLNAGNGVIDFYTTGVKTGGVGKNGFLFPKLAAAPTTAPGAGLAAVFAVAGTNTGTCKLQTMAGTSTTPITILDNIGTGC